MRRGGGPSALFGRAYRRLGPSYPRAAVLAVPQLGHLVSVLSIAGLALFVDMSWGEFLRIVLVGVGLMSIYNLAYTRVALGLLIPVGSWLEGERATGRPPSRRGGRARRSPAR